MADIPALPPGYSLDQQAAAAAPLPPLPPGYTIYRAPPQGWEALPPMPPRGC
jgi:hypothetical protein